MMLISSILYICASICLVVFAINLNTVFLIAACILLVLATLVRSTAKKAPKNES
jgi:hypothetical protein